MSRNKQNWDALVDEDGQYYKPGIGGGSGQKGDKGEPGPSGGDKGDKGEDGEKGAPGTNGTNGTPGTKGQKGEPGVKGDEGDTGAEGPKGEPGSASAKGDKGEPGEKGDPGNDGDKGDPGDEGPKGEPGTASSKGDKGEVGAEGDKGDKGDTGDTGQSAYDLAVSQGFSGTESQWIASLKGEAGDKGNEGDKGDKGNEGEKGEIGDSAYDEAVNQGFTGTEAQWIASLKGDKGDDGDKGEKGAPAPVLNFIDAVVTADLPDPTTVNAGDTYYLTDTGRYTSSNGTDWTDAGQMIKGDQGEKGDEGDKGDNGQKGQQGDTGDSAYQAAVDAGFTGGQGEWLDSLKGEQGPEGPKGQKGQDGLLGATGAKGQQGDTGDKGNKGSAAPLLNYIGSVNTTTERDALTGMSDGDTVFVNDGNNLYFTWDGSAWQSAGEVVKGDEGEKGDKGDKGEIGDTGTIGVGATNVVDSNSALVTNTGTSEAAVFAFDLPKGEKGDKGEKGNKGEVGDDAYQVAVDQGFTGTEQEWLDSLKGDKGGSGTATVGAVTVVAAADAAVTNVGTDEEAVFNFDLPKGEQGIQGADGRMPAAAVSAHVNFNAGTGNGAVPSGDINAQHEISGVEKLGTGHWRITFAITFLGAEAYTCVGTAGRPGDIGLQTGISLLFTNQTATSVEVFTERGDNGNQYDPTTVQCAFYGDGTGGQVVQKGDKGDAGGEKGDQGIEGAQGVTGEKGEKGLMPAGAASAHVAFDASAGNGFNFNNDVIASYNIGNIIRTGVGLFTISFSSPFNDASYTVVSSAGAADHTNSTRSVAILSQSASSVDIAVEFEDGTNVDDSYIALVIYGTGTAGEIVQGPKGEKGEFGGEKGDKGQTGDKGEIGEKGMIPAGAVTAHIAFNGEAAVGTITGTDIFSSYGISNLEKTGTGEYVVTFSQPFSGADTYTVSGTAGGRDFSGVGASGRNLNPIAFNANTCEFLVERADNGAQNDVPYVSILFYGTGSGGAPTLKGDKGEPGGEKGDKGAIGPASFDPVFASWDASNGPTYSWANDQISSRGVLSVTRLGTAEYRVDFTTAFADANYAAYIQVSNSFSADAAWTQISSRTASSLTFNVRQNGTAYGSTGEAADGMDFISVMVLHP